LSGITVRKFEPSDYPSQKATHDSIFPDHPMFLDEVRYEDSCYGRTRYRMKRFVAETASGQVVGFGEYKHLFFGYHPKRFALGIEVSPEWHRQGAGNILYAVLMKELAEEGAEVATSLVLSTSAAGIMFVRNRGSVEKRRTIESRLELDAFDPAKFSGSVESVKKTGIEVTSLSSELSRIPSCGRLLKDLEDSGAADVPGLIADSPMDYHDYEIVILDNPNVIWEGSFVAREGDRYLGSSTLLRSGEEGLVGQGFTVVRPEYRGKGIAQAVKVKAAAWAKSKGLKYIRTHNDAENAPMLAINRKIGFAKRAEWVTFERRLSE